MFISPPEKSFRQNYAGRILLLFVAGIIVLTVLALEDFHLQRLSMASLLVLLVTLGLTAFGWWAMSRQSVSLHPEGIECAGTFGTKDLRWEEVTETYFFKIDQNLYVHFGLLGLLFAAAANRRGSSTSKGLMNLRISGGEPKRKLRISSSLKDVAEAIRMVLAKVNPRIKTELGRQIQGGQAVMFGPVSLSREGIGYQQKPQVPFSEAAIKFNGARLTVKKQGKWLNAISVQAQKVPNVFVLLDLAEELKLGGAPRPPDPFAHMAR